MSIVPKPDAAEYFARFCQLSEKCFTPNSTKSENRSKINTPDSSSETLLTLAIRMGSLEIAKTLLEAGANPNLPNASAQTPLHIAVLEPDVRFSTHLILKGANLALKDLSGETPLDLLKKSENLFPGRFDFLKSLKNLFKNDRPPRYRNLTVSI